MVDVRKKTGPRGTTYQVRYAARSAGKSSYAYKTFKTLKEARSFVERDLPKHRSARHATIRTVDQAIQKWLDACKFEGRHGRDKVSAATFEVYEYRADIMRQYEWGKALHELEAPDVTAFRSWLLKTYSRDQAKKVLSSFHSALLEMVAQGVLSVDPAAGITVQEARNKDPVQIPSVDEMKKILKAADALANETDERIGKAWKRYRAMIYLAADTGMRPQELLALPIDDLLERGVRVTRVIDRSNNIGPPKSRAGRRFIPVGADTLEMVRTYLRKHQGENPTRLVFPGDGGSHQRYNNYLRRGWHVLMERAGLMEDVEEDGETVSQPMYTPYALRHFFASMLISQNKDLKTLQERMGHEDAAMTLNVYGHLIRRHHAERSDEVGGILAEVLQ
jgi:integrase